MTSALGEYVAAYTSRGWVVEKSGHDWVQLRRPSAGCLHLVLAVLTLGLWLLVAGAITAMSRRPITLFVGPDGQVMVRKHLLMGPSVARPASRWQLR